MFVPFRARAAALALLFGACAYPGSQATHTHSQRFLSSWQEDAPAATFAERSAALPRIENRASGGEQERTSFNWRAGDEPRVQHVAASYFAANRGTQPLGWPSRSAAAR